MKKVLVIGGAGFIGSNLVNRLLCLPGIERVDVVDNFSSKRGVPLPTDLRLRVYEQAVADLSPDFATGIDTVFHLASNPDIAKAVTDPGVDFWHGTLITHQVLELCRLSQVPRLIYASGSGVYGECPTVLLNEDYGPCLPVSTYGASKLAGEAMISAYCRMFNLSAIAFRFANVIGPGQTHGVGYDFMRRLKVDSTRLRILGDGTQRKPYIHVDDVLRAVLLANEQHESGFETYNVSPRDALTVRQIADLAVKTHELDPLKVEYEFTGGDRGWSGDVPVVQLDATKIRRLGWTPAMNSLGAMRCALDSMLDQL